MLTKPYHHMNVDRPLCEVISYVCQKYVVYGLYQILLKTPTSFNVLIKMGYDVAELP